MQSWGHPVTHFKAVYFFHGTIVSGRKTGQNLMHTLQPFKNRALTWTVTCETKIGNVHARPVCAQPMGLEGDSRNWYQKFLLQKRNWVSGGLC